MSRRAVFFEEEHARTAAARLAADGFEAVVHRERFAGEDDDEDHPWAVVSDAPAFVVELLVEQFDGWLDADQAPSPGAATRDRPAPSGVPLELPDGPRRVKGHFADPRPGPANGDV